MQTKYYIYIKRTTNHFSCWVFNTKMYRESEMKLCMSADIWSIKNAERSSQSTLEFCLLSYLLPATTPQAGTAGYNYMSSEMIQYRHCLNHTHITVSLLRTIYCVSLSYMFCLPPKHIPDTLCMCILKQPLLLLSGHGLCSSWCQPAFWHSSAGTGSSGAHGPYLMRYLKKAERRIWSAQHNEKEETSHRPRNTKNPRLQNNGGGIKVNM